MTTETSTIPPDDLQRNLTLARPNEDQKLPHIGLSGDTYTILLTGEDTAGRYCLIDMLVPPGGAGAHCYVIAQAALDAGVRRYFPWHFGVDYDLIGRGSAQDLFDEQLDVRDLLRSQDRTEWIIVSTGMFTSFLFEPSFGVVNLAQNTVHALGSWDTAVTVTTPEDIGNLTAAICFAEPRIVNSIVYTAGDTVTYAQLANIADSVLGRKVRRVEWSVPELKDELAKDPADAIKKYRVVFAEGKGVSWDMDQTFNAQRGIEVTGVERWAKENLR